MFGRLPGMAEQVLGGRFALLDRLGSGGMSVVWRARDEVLGRTVAVKLLAGRYADDPDSRDRIRDEARAAAHAAAAAALAGDLGRERGNRRHRMQVRRIRGVTHGHDGGQDDIANLCQGGVEPDVAAWGELPYFRRATARDGSRFAPT